MFYWYTCVSSYHEPQVEFPPRASNTCEFDSTDSRVLYELWFDVSFVLSWVTNVFFTGRRAATNSRRREWSRLILLPVPVVNVATNVLHNSNSWDAEPQLCVSTFSQSSTCVGEPPPPRSPPAPPPPPPVTVGLLKGVCVTLHFYPIMKSLPPTVWSEHMAAFISSWFTSPPTPTPPPLPPLPQLINPSVLGTDEEVESRIFFFFFHPTQQ